MNLRFVIKYLCVFCSRLNCFFNVSHTLLMTKTFSNYPDNLCYFFVFRPKVGRLKSEKIFIFTIELFDAHY